jgi:hypothetical protein
MTREQEHAVNSLRSALHEYLRVFRRSALVLALIDALEHYEKADNKP